MNNETIAKAKRNMNKSIEVYQSNLAATVRARSSQRLLFGPGDGSLNTMGYQLRWCKWPGSPFQNHGF